MRATRKQLGRNKEFRKRGPWTKCILILKDYSCLLTEWHRGSLLQFFTTNSRGTLNNQSLTNKVQLKATKKMQNITTQCRQTCPNLSATANNNASPPLLIASPESLVRRFGEEVGGQVAATKGATRLYTLGAASLFRVRLAGKTHWRGSKKSEWE